MDKDQGEKGDGEVRLVSKIVVGLIIGGLGTVLAFVGKTAFENSGELKAVPPQITELKGNIATLRGQVKSQWQQMEKRTKNRFSREDGTALEVEADEQSRRIKARLRRIEEYCAILMDHHHHGPSKSNGPRAPAESPRPRQVARAGELAVR